MLDGVKPYYCIEPECIRTRAFGYPGKPHTYCRKHHLPGMMRRSKSKCVECKINQAIYGHSSPERCEEHRQEGDYNLVEKDCVSCGLLYLLDDNGHCPNCNPEWYKIVRLVKQNAVMTYLDARGFSGDSTDCPVDTRCGR
jgi:hypothetical protein